MAAERILKVVIAGDAAGLAKVFDGVGNDLSKVEGRFGGFAGKAAVIGGATATAVGVAGAALFKLGGEFDSASDSIRIATGKTGDDLKSLEQSFRNVASKVPADFGTVSDAIGGLASKTGLAKKPLEDLARQVINLSRITGSDLNKNVDTAAKLMGDWKVPADQMSGVLDGIFKVSQNTGVSFDTLVTNLDRFGPTFRQLKVPMGEGVTLLGEMEKAGVPAEAVMSALGKAAVKAADGHTSISAAMKDSIQKIKDAKDPQDALTMATDLFGKKVSIEMVDAIRTGKLSLDGLVDGTTGASGAINQTATDTDDASQKMQVAFNNMKIALEPVATGIFNFAGTVLEKATPAIQGFTAWLSESFVPALQNVATWLNDNVGPAVQAVAAWVRDDLAPAMQAAWENVIKPAIEGMADAAKALADFFADYVVPAIEQAWSTVSAATTFAWDNVIKPTFDALTAAARAVADFFRDYVAPVLVVAWDVVRAGVDAAWTVIKGQIDAFKLASQALADLWRTVIAPVVSAAWDAIKATATTAWGVVEAHIAAFKTAGQALANLWRDVVAPVVSAAWTAIKNAAEASWKAIDAVIDAFQTAGSALAKAWSETIAPAISGAWNGIKNAFQFAWPAIQAVLTALQGAFNLVKGAVESLIGAIERLIDLIASIPRSISIAINWLIPDMPDIPGDWNPFDKKADGGYANTPTVSLWGEAGPEVILPLTRPDRMRELLAMPEVAPAVMGALLRSPAGSSAPRPHEPSGEVTVNVYVNGNVMRERDLALTIRDELIRAKREGVTIGLG